MTYEFAKTIDAVWVPSADGKPADLSSTGWLFKTTKSALRRLSSGRLRDGWNSLSLAAR